MNRPAHAFRALLRLWRHRPDHPHLEVLGAELAARLAAAGGRGCVALLPLDEAAETSGLEPLLADYGLSLHRRCREGGDAVFVDLVAAPAAPPFRGATVRAVRVAARLEAC